MKKIHLLKYALILLLGIAISGYAFLFINNRILEDRKEIVHDAVASIDVKINRELKNISLVMESVRLFVKNTPALSNELFIEFTNPYILELIGIKAIEWAPRLTLAERDPYVEKQRQIHGSDFKITQRDASGKLVSAGDRSFYYPVQFINPIANNEQATGFDLASNPQRNQSILNTLVSGKISFTEPLNLVQEEEDKGFGILVIRAHIESADQPPLGVLVGVYNMNEFIAKTIEAELQYLNVKIYDKMDYSIIYSDLESSQHFRESDKQNEFQIMAADRIWTIIPYSKAGYLSYPHNTIAYIILAAGLFITMLIILTSFRDDNYKDSLKQNIQERTDELENLIHQKDTLLKEIHHRVKNNLQVVSGLLSLQSSTIEDESSRSLFDESQNRINSMATIHQMLYQTEDLSRINFSVYIPKLVNDLIFSFKGEQNNIKVDARIGRVSLNIDTAIPLGLIITEIVTNTLKFGIPQNNDGTIIIRLFKQENQIFKLEIGDDGPGYRTRKMNSNTTSLGLRLIHNLVEQLKGDIKKMDDKAGSHYSIHFKEI